MFYKKKKTRSTNLLILLKGNVGTFDVYLHAVLYLCNGTLPVHLVWAWQDLTTAERILKWSAEWKSPMGTKGEGIREHTFHKKTVKALIEVILLINCEL